MKLFSATPDSSRSMSDISAVVLTTGEDTTQRAIESVNKQTLAPREIIVIENVVPFHRALNLGASKVKTEFFVQVDSDMILDEDCFKELRRCMRLGIGIVEGVLRDPLVGSRCCIKMFRQECFAFVRFGDSISPDTDFSKEILKYGWKTTKILEFAGQSKKLLQTLGEHNPSYSPHYTFSKYLLTGRRYRYRKDLPGLLGHLKRLRNSSHSASLIAQIAMAHGIFLEEDRDLLKPASNNKDFDFLSRFLTAAGHYKIDNPRLLPLFFFFNLKTKFKQHYKLGIELRKADAFPAFKYCLEKLSNSYDEFTWVAKTGLCHGLFAEAYCDESVEGKYKILEDLISKYTLFAIAKKHAQKMCHIIVHKTFSFLRNNIRTFFLKTP